jgi:hypothetical protein
MERSEGYHLAWQNCPDYDGFQRNSGLGVCLGERRKRKRGCIALNSIVLDKCSKNEALSIP